MNRAIQLVPGLVVNVATRVEGGSEYERVELEHTEEGGSDLARWETIRRIADKAEFDAANKLRSRCRGLVSSACVKTPFGFLLCPLDKEAELDAKLAEAKGLVAAFNANSVLSKVKLVSIRGTIAGSKGEAEAAVASEVGSIIEKLSAAIKLGEVQTIRDLCGEARSMGKLIEQQSVARGALDRAARASRKVARDIKRAADAGEDVAVVIERANLEPIAAARFAFSGAMQVDAEEEGSDGDLPSVELGRFAGLGGPAAGGPSAAAAEAAAGLLAELGAAIGEFGTYSFDDKGPGDVMNTAGCLHRLSLLSAADAAAALVLVAGSPEHGGRGEDLVHTLFWQMEENEARVAEMEAARPGLRSEIFGEQSEPVVVQRVFPLLSLPSVLAAAGVGSASPSPGSEDEGEV